MELVKLNDKKMGREWPHGTGRRLHYQSYVHVNILMPSIWVAGDEWKKKAII